MHACMRGTEANSFLEHNISSRSNICLEFNEIWLKTQNFIYDPSRFINLSPATSTDYFPVCSLWPAVFLSRPLRGSPSLICLSINAMLLWKLFCDQCLEFLILVRVRQIVLEGFPSYRENSSLLFKLVITCWVGNGLKFRTVKTKELLGASCVFHHP
jgi:hypothetical protein